MLWIETETLQDQNWKLEKTLEELDLKNEELDDEIDQLKKKQAEIIRQQE
mgnify:CR=1 FL=1